jgi:hypothetical protein
LFALIIAGLAASVITAVVQWASVARTKAVCNSDVEIARICAGRNTTLDLRVKRESNQRVSAHLGDTAKAIEQTGRAAARIAARRE